MKRVGKKWKKIKSIDAAVYSCVCVHLEDEEVGLEKKHSLRQSISRYQDIGISNGTHAVQHANSTVFHGFIPACPFQRAFPPAASQTEASRILPARHFESNIYSIATSFFFTLRNSDDAPSNALKTRPRPFWKMNTVWQSRFAFLFVASPFNRMELRILKSTSFGERNVWLLR